MLIPVSLLNHQLQEASALPIPTEVRASVNEDNAVVVSFPAVRDPDDTTRAVQV